MACAPGQIFEWLRAYREGRLAAERNATRLLPVGLSEVSRAGQTDVRRGTLGLSALVQTVLAQNPFLALGRLMFDQRYVVK